MLDLAVDDAPAVVSGRLLANKDIVGAVEADFFDCLLLTEGGADLVRSLASDAVRFRVRGVEINVLKNLYKSLIDPYEHHDLREYYTPNWPPTRVVRAAFENLLDESALGRVHKRLQP